MAEPTPPRGAYAGHPVHVHPARPLYRFAATALGASMWFFVCVADGIAVSCADWNVAVLPNETRWAGAAGMEASVGSLSLLPPIWSCEEGRERGNAFKSPEEHVHSWDGRRDGRFGSLRCECRVTVQRRMTEGKSTSTRRQMPHSAPTELLSRALFQQDEYNLNLC